MSAFSLAPQMPHDHPNNIGFTSKLQQQFPTSRVLIEEY
jgi:hypothetical protein